MSGISEHLEADDGDDSVAKAWAETMSTFTERTGLSVKNSDSSSTEEAVDDYVGWDEDWSDGEKSPGDNELGSEEDLPDEWGSEWGDDLVFLDDEWGESMVPTPAERERERLRGLKQKAEKLNERGIKRIKAERQRNENWMRKIRETGRLSSEQIAKIERLLDDCVMKRPGAENNYRIKGDVSNALENDEDIEMAFEVFDYQQEVEKSDEIGPEMSESINGALDQYHGLHGLDERRLRAFRQNVQPLMVARDDEVASLLARTNNWSVFTGESSRFGVADYTIHCLVQEVTPRNLNELLMVRREMPATDQYRLEQNRVDALELGGILFRARDFIHDESPGVHELLAAMLDYYESRDDAELHTKKRRELEEILEERDRDVRYYNVGSDNFVDFIFNVDNYEKPVQRRKLERESWEMSIGGEKTGETEPAVECLRRLVENTNMDTILPPETEVPELNEMMKGLRINQNERTGETHVDWGQAGKLTKKMNEVLMDCQGKDGLRPSMVEAVAFVERIATFALRDVSDRDWRELPYDPNFKEFVRFTQLAYSSEPYDARRFDRIYEGAATIPNGDLSDENLRAFYGKIQGLVLRNMAGLALKYKKEGLPERANALWSGNLVREMVALADTDRHSREGRKG